MRAPLVLVSATIAPFAILAVATGCLPIPPQAIHLIPEQTIRTLEPRRTTRTDVLLMLADPTERGDGDEYFIYRWEEMDGGLVFFPSMPVAGVAASRCNRLVIQFLPDGRVARMKKFSGESNVTHAPTFSGEERAKFGSAYCDDPEILKAIEDWLREGRNPDPPATLESDSNGGA